MLSIITEELSKIYKGSKVAALDSISLTVRSRQVFTLLGRNGAGKTTFVRICATQMMPTSGKVNVLGYDVITEPRKVRDLISIVPQEGRPLRALTPWDHVFNWLQIRGQNRTDAKINTKIILENLELYDVKDRPAMNLSGGMKQKILVAMAMATDAQLLFLDEPTIGLDPISRRQVWSAIKKWKTRGKSILLTTHYMDEAEMLSDRIAIIDRGRLLAGGSMDDLRKIIPQKIRIDIMKDMVDPDMLRPFGSVIDTGANTIRVFAFESAAKELSEFALRKKIAFTVSPVTLDDVFVSLLADGNMQNGLVRDDGLEHFE
ncbi:MAG: ABC transporter ATP-binding protein [Nitrososphaeraceae archaeon]